MKKNKGEVWPNEFNFENFNEEKLVNVSHEALEDSYQALNKLYQKDARRSKPPKKGKYAWQ